MYLDLTAPEDKKVTQDNQLIEACYKMSLNEKRLLLLGISKVNPKEYSASDGSLKIEVNASEWERVYKDDTNAWRAIKRTADKLLNRQIIMHPKAGVTDKVNWFERVRYYENEARIEVVFTRFVQTRLVNLLEQFTTIDLLSINKLKSFYSIRLYEILSQFKGTGYRKISVEDFRFAMDTVNKNPETKQLKSRVLMPALNEINQKSDLECTVKDVRKGRKITHFEFSFHQKQQQSLL